MTKYSTSATGTLFPSLGIVVGGALWGLFWVPVRWLEQIGLEGAWPGAMIYAGTFLCLLPIALIRWRQIAAKWKGLLVSGLFTGTAFSLYSTSLLLTDIVHSILLFYLTPVWGTVLGIAVLKERLTAARGAALILGITGLLVVLGAGTAMPWPRNLGDWLALMAGISWAYGSLKVYQTGQVAIPEQMFAFIGGSFAVTMLTILFGGAAFGGMAETRLLSEAVPLSLALVLYMLPMLFLTVWPATLLTPGRIGMLLMSEVIVGVVSAAVWSGDPFGWRETIGTVLIVSAGFVEVAGNRSSSGHIASGNKATRS